MENILTIKEYFSKRKFIIPNYQRGYKWGVPNSDGSCAVSVLMDNLIETYQQKMKEYFIQGVTVVEDNNNIILIDGQQRTTTFYLLLKYLGYKSLPEISYDIRQESDDVLKKCTIENGELNFNKEEGKDYDLQDIFYFKKAIKTIHDNIKDNIDEKEKFKDWILASVKLFYITIASEKATKVFSMMNGQKAVMKPDELIKSALLSKASRPVEKKGKENLSENELDVLLDMIKNKVGKEWEINALRSRYAREWDKWLYWWNRKDVKEFFNSGNNPMGLLLEYYFYFKKEEKQEEYNYKNFNERFFKDIKSAKDHYKGIRNLQKTFEDWYNKYETYNYLGLIIKGGGNKKDALLYFLKDDNDSIDKIKDYAKWTLVDATHKQITIKKDELEEEDNKEIVTKESKAETVIDAISKKVVYEADGHNFALKQLLRRNVEMDNKLERKFDFALYGEQSLEHIYPKSWENEEDSKLKFDKKDKDKYSVHCIGNLVLIKKNENSQFSNKTFEEKKDLYFDMENTKWSLKFLHSVSVFSKNKWGKKQIKDNYEEFINELKDYYKE